MAKHITIMATLTDNYTRVEAKILKQTHRGVGFGAHGNSYVASNGVNLTSSAVPECRFHRGLNLVYMWGSHRGGDGNELLMSLADFARFKQAVE